METPYVPMNRAQKSAQKRQKIIDAARELLKGSDYENLTVRKICERAEINIGSFYNFFKSKDDLMNVFLSWDNPPAPEDELGNLVDYIIGLYEQIVERFEELGLEFTSQFFNPRNPVFNFRARTNGVFTTDLYEPMLWKAQKMGYIKSNRSVESILYDIQVLVIGNVFEWCVFGFNIGYKENIGRMLRDYLELDVFTEKYFEDYPQQQQFSEAGKE